MDAPATTIDAGPAVIIIKPRRSKRKQDAALGNRRSERALKRRHSGNDGRIYGFICGYPVGTGGELYGGSMFHPSAATDTLQGKAIQKINEVWGEEHRGWNDYKNIGIPVCKKKYRPFEFQIKKRNKMGGVEISVVRMYGCCTHSNIRKAVIERHGERKGWEPFGQWSLSKAKTAARGETQRLNAELYSSSSSLSDTSYESDHSSSSEEVSPPLCMMVDTTRQQQPWHALCANGTCNWKMRGKVDDICQEIEEERLNKVDE